MKEHPMRCHKIVQGVDVPVPTDTGQIPHRMVEDNKDIADVVQHFEELVEPGLATIFRVVCEERRYCVRFSARQIVNSQMENRVFVWNRPFD